MCWGSRCSPTPPRFATNAGFGIASACIKKPAELLGYMRWHSCDFGSDGFIPLVSTTSKGPLNTNGV